MTDVNIEIIRGWLLGVIGGLVDGDVDVSVYRGEQTVVFNVRVGKSDVGKLIGKQGRTVSAVRALLICISAKHGLRCVMEVLQ